MDTVERSEIAKMLETPEMTERRGLWLPGETSPAIAESDIRRWGTAVYWPEQPPGLFWDEAFAASTRWRGIVAPEDFNPFAWPAGGRRAESVEAATDRYGLPMPTQRRASQAQGGVHIGGMNAGRVEYFHERMRPGDIIASRSRLAGWALKTTRFGPSLFATIESEWHNQRGELVRVRRQSTVRYVPGPGQRTSGGSQRPPALPSEFPAWARVTGLEHWNRYAAVNDEFVDMHMSDEAGVRAGNPRGAFGMGNLRYAYLLNAIRQWFGLDVEVRQLQCEFRALNQKGDELTVRGAATGEAETATGRALELVLDVTNQDGVSTTPASATVEVPRA